jgi:hypothetical protein
MFGRYRRKPAIVDRCLDSAVEKANPLSAKAKLSFSCKKKLRAGQKNIVGFPFSPLRK